MNKYRYSGTPVVCPTCGTEFQPRSHTHKYCKQECRPTGREGYGRGMYPGLCTGTAGAVSELRVAADLLAKGYHVYRALSQAAPCDLIAIGSVDGRLRQVEVRTAAKGLKRGSRGANDLGRQDVYADVTFDGIIYSPEMLPQASQSDDLRAA